VNNGPDIAKALDDIANQLQTLADRAVPAANRIARVIHFGGLLGLAGGLLGSAALALPGFGFIRSWVFFVLLALVAVGCAAVVFHWSTMLQTWTGDVKQVVGRLRDVPSPGKMVDELREGSAALVPHGGTPGSSRSSVIALVRVGTDLRKRLTRLPGAADKARELFVELTGPFRPPLLAVRFALLIGGLVMVVVGPLLALIAALT
jgi:hypothetical protein